MTNALTQGGAATTLIPVSEASSAAVEAAAPISGGGGKFLPRLQFMGSSNKLVKAGDFPTNHFAAVSGSEKDDHLDLGDSIDILVLGIRTKALDTSDKDDIKVSYDMAVNESGEPTGLFLEIMDRADAKEEENMYGPEYLVWEASSKQFMTFFCCNPTLRNESDKITARLGDKLTLKKNFIKTKRFEYWSAKAHDCQTVFGIPEMDAIRDEQKKFDNPYTAEGEDTTMTDEQKAATGREQ